MIKFNRREFMQASTASLVLESAKGSASPGGPAKADETATPKVISVADFGAVPNDGKDHRTAITAAVAKVRQTPGATLLIPPGTYNVRSAPGIKLLDDLICGRVGWEKVQAIRYPEYQIGLDFSDLDDVTIDATGVELVCEGLMEPVNLCRCHRVTLKGLSIRYLRSPNSFGTIARVDNDSYDVVFDHDTPVGKEFFSWRVMIVHPVSERLSFIGNQRGEEIAPNVRRFHQNLPAELKGARVGFGHVALYRPGVTIQDSEAVLLKQVTVFEQCGTGILGWHCKDISLDGVRVTPIPGRPTSVCGDSTHFVSCSGEIRFEGCQFSGAADDGTNIHNYYYNLGAARGEKTRDLVVNTNWHNTHLGIVDAPEVGDKLALVDAASEQELDTFTITGVKVVPKEWRAEVTFDRELPADADRRLLVNITRFPRVTIRNCSVVNNRARGFLIKTGPALIENCFFSNVTGTPIQMGSEMEWMEGHHVHDIVIRNNRFFNCSYGEANLDDAGCVSILSRSADRSVPGLNKNLLIEDNLCESPDKHAFVIGSSDNVIIRRNHITGCPEPIYVYQSTRVRADDNYGAKLTAGPSCQTIPVARSCS